MASLQELVDLNVVVVLVDCSTRKVDFWPAFREKCDLLLTYRRTTCSSILDFLAVLDGPILTDRRGCKTFASVFCW